MRAAPSFDVESFVRVLRHLLAAHDGRKIPYLRPAEKDAHLARLAEQWKSFDFLPEILRNAPGALESAQVRAALEALRTERRARAEKDVPAELARLLRLVGDAIAKPAKVKKPDDGRRVLILNLWAVRHVLDDDEKERRARALGLKDWDSLSAVVRRWKPKRRG